MNTLLSFFCEECGAALTPQDVHCFACKQPVDHVPLTNPIEVVPHISTSPSAITAGAMDRDSYLTRRYTVLRQIGDGGFGVVYLAKDRYEKNRLVAIKQINLSTLSPQEMIEATDSYNREVMLLSKLKHPHLPQIYDRFTDPEHWYIVMQFIDGETLEEYLKKAKQGYLSVKEVLRIGVTLCDVLHYLHSQHPPIIFRDVKPGNIMYSRQGQIYLIDFGIARHYIAKKVRDTGPLGSPGYAAPEQYGRTQTTVQTDIFGLGATLQTLLTGKEPLELAASSEREMYLNKIPPKLASFLEQMQEYDASQRPVSMEEVKSYLLYLIEQEEITQQRVKHVFASTRRILMHKRVWQLLLTLFFLSTFIGTPLLIPALILIVLLITGRSLMELYAETHWYTKWPGAKKVGKLLWDHVPTSMPYILAFTFYCAAFNVSADTEWFILYLPLFIFIACVCIGFNLFWLVKLLIVRLKSRHEVKSAQSMVMQQFQYRP